MTPRPIRLDAEVVRAQLNAVAVLDHFGVKYRSRGNEIRTRICPTCGQRARDCVCIAIDSGRWLDHAHGCSGDVFALLAGYAGLDVRRDFARVLDLAASIANLTDAEAKSRLTRGDCERQRRDRERQIDEARLRAAAEWRRLVRFRRHVDGERYLWSRGLDPRGLVERDHVRFTARGDVAAPLWDFDGELVNVVRRMIAPALDAPKVVGLPGCPTMGSLLGRVQEIGRGETMITEGMTDALTAAMIWPDRVVLGAHGAGRLADVARAAAPRVRAARGRFVLVPDADDVGQRCAIRAGEVAMAAGLVVDRDLLVVELDGHADLNAAWCTGWRP